MVFVGAGAVLVLVLVLALALVLDEAVVGAAVLYLAPVD